MSTAAATRSSVVGHRRVQGGRWWPEPQPEAHVPTPGTQGPPLAWGRQAPSRGDTARRALPCVPGCAGWRLSDHTGRETPRSLGAEAYGRRAPFPPRVLEPVSHLASSQGRRAAGPGASSHAAMGTGGAARRPARPSVRGACTGRCSTATSAETDSWRLKAFVSADRLARWWGPPLFREGVSHIPCCSRDSLRAPMLCPLHQLRRRAFGRVSSHGGAPRPGCHTALPRRQLWVPTSGL